MRLATTFVAVLCGLFTTYSASRLHGQELVYVKKETREATRQASLAASGQSTIDGKWMVIGPFDGPKIDLEHPPEKELKSDSKYPGKGGKEVAWQETDFKDGTINDVRRYVTNVQNAACYLYRKVESPNGAPVRVSLGSDDGLKIWLNGKQVLREDAVRPAAADQNYVNLDLNPGANDLLMKLTQGGGEWAFYFAPTSSAKLAAKLDQRLDQDFPQAGEPGHYRIVTLPLPDDELVEVGGLAWRPDGKLLVATRRGDIWLVENPLSDDLDSIKFKPYARGLHEILGLTLVGDDLYLVQRPEVTRVRDTNKDDVADEFTTITDAFGCSGDYHEYNYGPARDKDGNFFITTNVGFGGGHQAKVPYRGFCLKISPDGKTQPYAYGLRSPNGVNFSPDGKLFYCDNQGEWVASCKMHEIREGEFYGHMASVRWWEGKTENDRPEMTPPVIWFPYNLTRSTTEPIWDTTEGKFGPFAGQMIIGELTNSLLMRACLEEVNGRMQGAVFQFRTGFTCGVNRLKFAPDGSLFVGETNRGWGSVGGQPHGLQRVVYTGRKPFEILTMKVTKEGFDLTFTEPVDAAKAGDPATYFMDSYTYHHWGTYGSPEIERQENKIEKAEVSADGKSVKLTVAGRRLRFVHHLQVKGLKSAGDVELLHNEGWYTMNAIPE